MRSLFFTCLLVFSSTTFAKEPASTPSGFGFDLDIDGNDFKAALAVSKFQCGGKFKDYNFEKEFKSLFSHSYSNRDISKIKTMSQEIEKELRSFCDKNHYLLSGFKTQDCYQACWKNYPPEELVREQCQATCTSLDGKISSFSNDLAVLMDEGIANIDNCHTGSVRVDDSARGKSKVKQPSNNTIAPSNQIMEK